MQASILLKAPDCIPLFRRFFTYPPMQVSVCSRSAAPASALQSRCIRSATSRGFALTRGCAATQWRRAASQAAAVASSSQRPARSSYGMSSPPTCARRRATPTSSSYGPCTPASVAPAGLSRDAAAYGNGRREQVCHSSTATELPTAATVRRSRRHALLRVLPIHYQP